MIEVFGNRMEITNPGKPLIDVFRFIDHTPISRNENYSMASRIISDTISAGYIKLDDRESVMLNHHCPLLEHKHTRLQGIIRKAKCTSGLQAYHSL